MKPHTNSVTILLTLTIIAVATPPATAQQQTMGLFLHDPRAAEGYTLMTPRGSPITYLLDNDGLVVRTWTGVFPIGSMAYLSPEGDLFRAERPTTIPPPFVGSRGRGGLLRQLDWDGTQLWEFSYQSDFHLPHHDIEILPNGNVLMIAWELKLANEALQAGRNPALLDSALWPDHIIEVDPTLPDGSNIVWEWHVWDHLIQDFNSAMDNYGVVQDHPELIDVNFSPDASKDWNHTNGIDYNPELDQVVISVRRFNELWVIDHSTTTEEAAGHTGGNSGQGGDLLYRWGNPQAYRRGTPADQQLDGQHDAQWIDAELPGAGQLMIFDNGTSNPDISASTVKEIVPPVDEQGQYFLAPGEPFGPDAPAWIYPEVPDPDFFSPNVSGAHRQSNGNTVICEGAWGHLFEVTSDGEVVWDYINPSRGSEILTQGESVSNNLVFKVRRYPPDYPAFAGRDMTPGDPIENFTTPLPVPEGSLTAARFSPTDDALEIEWDADSCQSHDYKLLYGPLDELPDFGAIDAVCGIGVTGSYVWSDPPADSLYFLVAGTDPTAVYESSWGRASNGDERHATTSSFTCGTTTKIVSAQCP